MQRNFYGAYEFLRNFRNGNGEMATAERQRNGGNQVLVYYKSSVTHTEPDTNDDKKKSDKKMIKFLAIIQKSIGQ